MSLELPQLTNRSEKEKSFFRFSREISGATPKDPKSDFDHLCRCWQRLTNAMWVWLWMSDQSSDHIRRWEIVTVFTSGDKRAAFAPQSTKVNDGRGLLISYCSEVGRPIYVEDLDTWQASHCGIEYCVVRKEELKALGCVALLSIPLTFPMAGEEDSVAASYSSLTTMRGGLCLHFDHKLSEKDLLSEQEFSLMAQISANFIANSFAAEQRRILHKLDQLAADYLTRDGLKPEDRRKLYLEEVIKVIQQHLHVNYVSIFYRTDDEEEIECIATTGLEEDHGEIPTDSIELARYRKGECNTGRVYETGMPYIGTGHSGKFREVPCAAEETARYWVAWPIQPPGDESGKRKVYGVIRCVDNRARLVNDGMRPFDSFQLQTLEFIAAQSAPILETMHANIRREWTVNFVKHDLYAPLRLIEDQAHQIKEFLDKKSAKVSEYAAANILGAVSLAKNLASALSEQQAFLPEPTYLERHIIARLRDGLGRYAWITNRIKINYENLRAIPMLNIDRNLMERAISNLLVNAIKYGFRDTEIFVVGEARTDHFVIRVENYGIGIAEGDEEKIFAGTFRAKAAKERAHGLGLGLKLARASVRRNGGELILEQNSNPTVFAILLPRKIASDIRNR